MIKGKLAHRRALVRKTKIIARPCDFEIEPGRVRGVVPRLYIRDAPGRVRFVHLAGTPELFHARLARRAGHFMKPGMLDSQLATLEVPADAIDVDAAQPVADIVAHVRAALRI